MDLSKILSISGKGGLFKVVSQMKNAVLVESLVDQKRFPAFSHEKISSLEEIAVFTTGEDKPLKEILKSIHTSLEGKPAPDFKSDTKAMTAFFVKVVPDYDQERVYQSDIKKMLMWYNLLLENDLLDFSEAEEEKPVEATEEPAKEESPVAEAETEAKPKAKKTAAKKPKKE